MNQICTPHLSQEKSRHHSNVANTSDCIPLILYFFNSSWSEISKVILTFYPDCSTNMAPVQFLDCLILFFVLISFFFVYFSLILAFFKARPFIQRLNVYDLSLFALLFFVLSTRYCHVFFFFYLLINQNKMYLSTAFHTTQAS